MYFIKMASFFGDIFGICDKLLNSLFITRIYMLIWGKGLILHPLLIIN